MIVPSTSLLPDDPSVLFTTAGMQPMIPYLLGEATPPSKRLANSQKCFRAQDIDEVGDNRHTTFFEMLGNWSFGDYWKEEQLSWIFDFLKNEINLNMQNLYVTVFEGNEQIPKDEDSAQIWRKLFRDAKLDPDGHIFYYGLDKNWWSRAGHPDNMAVGEPGGPDSEMFYDFGPSKITGEMRHDSEKFGTSCHVNCNCGRYLEIGNSVFMEYKKEANGSFSKLPQRNVDFGGGLERISAAVNNEPDLFKLDSLSSEIEHLKMIVGKSYDDFSRSYRIVADHIRAAVFMISDGVKPSNKTQGYVLRRLLRRCIFLLFRQNISDSNWYKDIIFDIGQVYHSDFPEIAKNEHEITNIISEESKKFHSTIRQGIKEVSKTSILNSKIAFDLYQSHGFPFELTEEIARERGQNVEYGEFRKEFEIHQEKSRAGLEKKFGGHGLLLDTGELKASNEVELVKVTRLHTATHMLQAGLRKILGSEVHQAGSDITADRLRFDFTFSRKVSPEEIKKIEDLINDAIKQSLPVTYKEMSLNEAKKTDALYFFKEKYPDTVKVYSVGPAISNAGQAQSERPFSMEFCGGPHVSNTKEIGNFKIIKEEAVSSGTRRIRATVE